MARRPSLKPQLNQIRTWVGEGVTDIWIAHQLDRTPAEIADFRRKHDLPRPGEEPAPAKPKPRTRTAAKKPKEAPKEAAAPSAEDDAEPAKRRRRGRRGGRGRGKGATAIAATVEHGDDGLVIRIDAAVLEAAAYREHWVDVATGAVKVTADGIAITPGD